jgi:nucleoside-diphosphate-sugar epimerase
MRRVLVTGGGGFVGLAIVRQLIDMGVATSVVGRRRYQDAAALGADCLIGDIRDRDFMIGAVAGHDTVFHAAAKAGIWGRKEAFQSVNVTGTENVIAACLAQGVENLVYTSTPSVVFDGSPLEGGDESLPYSRRPLCDYAATKIVAEQKVLAANSAKLKTVALRPHLIWGPGDTQIIPRILQRGRQGKLKIVGSGENRVDITYIDNAAAAHILAARNLEETGSAAGETFFISQGEPVVLWDWINALFVRVDIPQLTARISYRTAYRAGWMLEKIHQLLDLDKDPRMTRFLAEQLAMSHWFSIEKARRILGYEPVVSSDEGMERLAAWLRGNGRPIP